MNSKQIAEALDIIATGFAKLAAAIEQPGSPLPVAPAAGSARPAPAETFEDGVPLEEPPLDPELFMERVVKTTGGTEILPDVALGYCPTHKKPWTVKAAGVSKKGVAYKAFWKCAERDDDGYCNQKPIKAWADSHPTERAA